MSIVLDASALLAFLHDEPGSDKVDAVIGQSIITTVNWSEVAQKSLSRGVDIDGLLEDIQSLGVSIEVFTLEDAESAAKLWPITRSIGLSLGDRACLAFAIRRQAPVLTADRAWLKLAASLKLDIRGMR